MGGLRNILTETRNLVENTPQEMMQYIRAFAKVNSEKYQELLKWASTREVHQQILWIYLKAWSSKEYEGDLDLRYIPIEDLGSLQRVKGTLAIQGTKIESLGQLQRVDNHLYAARGSGLEEEGRLTDLGQLQSVGMDLEIDGSFVRSLGQLKSVGRNFILYDTPLARSFLKQERASKLKPGSEENLAFLAQEAMREQVDVGGYIKFVYG